jgi:hypothetical protein
MSYICIIKKSIQLESSLEYEFNDIIYLHMTLSLFVKLTFNIETLCAMSNKDTGY